MKRGLNNPGFPSPPSGDLPAGQAGLGGQSVWEFIHEKLSAGVRVILLYVLKSEGSSPGRAGFKMAVADDGTFSGTIGGGIMEHKFVEKARSLLQQNETGILLQEQFHDKESATNRSGMICSGSQLNAFIPISLTDKAIIEEIIASPKKQIQLSNKGITLVENAEPGLRFDTDTDWTYTEPIDDQPVIHIIGGGHVGLALSELMHFLGFYIKLYDDRPELNTIAANFFAHEKYILNYETIADNFPATKNDFVVIMTIGYRTDKLVLKQLVNKNIFYLGVLGSRHKMDTLFYEMRAEGIGEEVLKRVFSPIGLNIASKTAKEIAVSIAAEIIKEKNSAK